jgi:GntR family transcriptional regulator
VSSDAGKTRDKDGPPDGQQGIRRIEMRSLTTQTRDVLMESILSGAFAGDKLPPEAELAAQLGVSRATLRGSLRSLEDQGLIRRQRGVGTLINNHAARSTVSLGRVVGFHNLIQESGYRSEIAWTKLSEAGASSAIAERVGCENGAPLYVVDRLFLADSIPAIHVVENIPQAEVIRPFTAESFPASIFEFAAECCRHPIDQTVLDICATTAPRELTSVLGVAKGAALLELEELHYSGSRPTMFSKIYAVPPLIRFAVVRTRS